MSKSEIFFKVPGGLGNQLFSYFCAAYVVQEFDCYVELDFSSVDRSHHTTTIPLLSMEIVPKRIKIKESTLATRSVHPRLSRFKESASRFLKLKNSQIFLPGLDSKENLNQYFESEFQSRWNSLTIDGYFGDFGFYDSLDPATREVRLTEPSENFLNLREEFIRSPYAAVHHRLGDFLSLSGSVGVLGKEYYETAFRSSKEMGISHFQVFTNDSLTSQAMFRKWGFNLDEMQWIDNNYLHDPLENLLLMGSSKVLIASNSTFSFWSGKLAGKNCARIFYPSKFRRDGLTKVENIPSAWTPVESKWDAEVSST